MKLSKSQQDVVDKMRRGYAINFYHTNSIWLSKGAIQNLRHTVWYKTFSSLKGKGIIYQAVGGFPEVYRLTEQYKNEQK